MCVSLMRLVNQFAYFFNEKIRMIGDGLRVSCSDLSSFSHFNNLELVCCLEKFTPTTVDEL